MHNLSAATEARMRDSDYIKSFCNEIGSLLLPRGDTFLEIWTPECEEVEEETQTRKTSAAFRSTCKERVKSSGTHKPAIE